MKKYWSDKAASLTPYTAGEQPKEKLIKLNTNENAFPPSPRVGEAISARIPALRLYPNPNSDGLCAAIARREGLRPGQVFCANGSDEALALCFLAFYNQDGCVKTPDVTYSFYPVWADLFSLRLEAVPLRGDYTVDIPAMESSGGVVLPNPNAPTGIALSLSEIETIVRHTKGVCLVDEAYIAFGGQSAVSLLDKYDNLAIVRTLSKSHSLAGLRVGYVLASENLIDALRTVKDSFNSYPVDTLAQAGAIAALEDESYYAQTTKTIVKTREYTAAALQEMGLRVLPSSANFLFVHCGPRAEQLFEQLYLKGVLVRYFRGPRTGEFLRVTIGLREDMDCFLEAMRALL